MQIIDRDEWGAEHEDGFHDRRLPAEEVWLHHSVTIAPDLLPPWDDDYAAIRTLERIGEQRFRRGISYTWPITPAGLVFEGHSPHRSGSHTKNRNDLAAAICFVGNYDVTEPTEEQIRAAAWTLVTAKRRGWIRHARINGGHQQAPGQDPTGCPGRYALAAIPRINALAADYEAGRIDLEDTMSAADAHNGIASFFRELASDSTDPAVEASRRDVAKVLGEMQIWVPEVNPDGTPKMEDDPDNPGEKRQVGWWDKLSNVVGTGARYAFFASAQTAPPKKDEAAAQ